MDEVATPRPEEGREDSRNGEGFSHPPPNLEALPPPTERDGPRLGGVGFDGTISFVTSLGARPTAEAIAYRVFKAFPAIIDPGAFVTTTKHLLNPVLLGNFPEVEPWDTWTWLKSMKNGRRRKILIRAWRLMTDRGQRHAMFEMISPFVKTENLPWFAIVDGMPIPEAVRYVARLIQAPHDETHLIAGPYLKPLTQALKSHWSSDNWIFYASATPEKLDGWLRANANATSYFWSDYSAFDATWSKYAWEMVETFYRHVYPNADKDFWEVLDIWRCPRGKVRCRKEDVVLSYSSEEANASGRDDTALANALLNGLALAMSIAAALAGCDPSQVTVDDLVRARSLVRIAIVGDDSLVCCDFDVTGLQGEIQRCLEMFGLVVKAESSRNLWDVTFLGSMPYMTRSGLYWGPTIGRRMYKAFWQADPVGHLPSWTKGVAMQLALNTHVPILSDVAQRVVSLLERHSGLPSYDEDKPHYSRAVSTVPWDELTVEWMCRRYDRLSPKLFERDLQSIRSIERLPAVMHSEVFSVCVAVDDL